MSYLNDLDACVQKAEELVQKLEEAIERSFFVAADAIKMDLDCTLKSARFCINCAKRKAEKLSKFECAGGCIHMMPLEEYAKILKNSWYILHWTKMLNKQGKP